MPTAMAASVGGNVSVTSEYIYRGLSESDGHAAMQVDLHASTQGGTFLGVWGSTRSQNLEPGARYDVELYAGHRFDLSSSWNATLNALSYHYVGGGRDLSNDYQEVSASVSYLDRWTVSLSAIPNAVRYGWRPGAYYRLGRYPAYAADSTGQWLLTEGLFLTGGVGYYYFSASGASPGEAALPAAGYLYGNVGFAFEREGWRVDVGYYFAQQEAHRIFPYPIANNRFAGTVSWHF
jgi:Bacterial protein of unknown function (Gcw_chp)